MVLNMFRGGLLGEPLFAEAGFCRDLRAAQFDGASWMLQEPMRRNDTNTPHPHTSEFRLQGSKGVWVCDAGQIYLEGRSRPNEWQSLKDYAEFDHPLWRREDGRSHKTARGHGGGSDTAVMWERYFNAIRTGTEPDMTVYDAAAWSAIVPLSEQSVAGNGRPVDFPDFTRGRWKTAGKVTLA